MSKRNIPENGGNLNEDSPLRGASVSDEFFQGGGVEREA